MVKELKQAIEKLGYIKDFYIEEDNSLMTYEVVKGEDRNPLIAINTRFLRSSDIKDLSLELTAAMKTNLITMFDIEIYQAVYRMEKSNRSREEIVEYIDEISTGKALINVLNYKHFQEEGLLEEELEKDYTEYCIDKYQYNESKRNIALGRGYLDKPLIYYFVKNYEARELREKVRTYLKEGEI